MNMNNIDRFFTKDSKEFAKKYLAYIAQVLAKINVAEISVFINQLMAARERGATIFFIGNGGSAATASHFANDLSIGVGDYQNPFRALSLSDNLAIITAIGNDFGYEDIFSRQLQIMAKDGDMVVAISASGNSPNLIKALDYANSINMTTVAITAFDGGRMKTMADIGVHVPTDPREYGPAEDAHMILDHLVSSYFMRIIRANGC